MVRCNQKTLWIDFHQVIKEPWNGEFDYKDDFELDVELELSSGKRKKHVKS